jgi:8-oxo-dGTP pyrophosphatase MutT (NUDIX family)
MLNFKNKHELFNNLKSILQTELIPTDIWQASADSEFKPAAVLIPLFWENEDLHILLTKRSEELKHHPGQISFPGGGFEPSDGTIRQSAIRETTEELGISEEHISVVGYLENLQTISGFHVTPFVAILEPEFTLVINPDEVAEAFSVPLSYFLDFNNRLVRKAEYKNKMHKYYIYQYQNYTIWGVTAEIIVKLSQKLTSK